MDHASFHQDKKMKHLLSASGHTLLYLPLDSPDLNPIEKKWAQAKAIRRRTEETIDELFKNHKI